MLEKEVERKLSAEVKKIGGVTFKFLSSVNGVPDRIVILPGGRIVFVELKAPGKKTRPLQDKRIRDIRKLGAQVEVLDSVEQVDDFIRGVTA